MELGLRSGSRSEPGSGCQESWLNLAGIQAESNRLHSTRNQLKSNQNSAILWLVSVQNLSRICGFVSPRPRSVPKCTDRALGLKKAQNLLFPVVPALDGRGPLGLARKNSSPKPQGVINPWATWTPRDHHPMGVVIPRSADFR